MKGPISSKATCLLTVPEDNAVDSTKTLTVPFSSRTFSVPSTKDGGNLFFTIYQINLTTGEVDYDSPDILQTSGLSVATDGIHFSNLILLEGKLKKESGTFASRETVKTI